MLWIWHKYYNHKHLAFSFHSKLWIELQAAAEWMQLLYTFSIGSTHSDQIPYLNLPVELHPLCQTLW